MGRYSSLCVYWNWPRRFRRLQGVLVLVSCFITLLTAGSLYTYGNLVPYIVSYLRFRSRTKDLRYNDATYVYVVQTGVSGFVPLIGGYLARFVGPRVVTIVGCLIMTSGTLLSSLTIRHSFGAFLFTYGVLFGAGLGTVYITAVSVAIRWWPQWKAVATGIVLSGFGLSSLAFNAIQTVYINPHNLKPDYTPYLENPQEKYFSQEDILNRVPYVFLVLGFCYLTIQILGSILIIYPSPTLEASNGDTRNLTRNKDLAIESNIGENIEDDNLEKEAFISSNSRTCVEGNISLKPLQMMKTCNFYILCVIFAVVGTVGAIHFALYKTFALEVVTQDDHYVTLAGSIASVVGVFGRITWGVVNDTVGYKNALVVNSGLMSILMFTFYATSEAGRAMLFVWICLITFCIAGFYIHLPAALAQSYGQEYLSANYGILFASHTLGGLLAGLVSDYAVVSIGWHGVFLLTGSLNCVQLILTLFYRHVSYSSKQYRNFSIAALLNVTLW